MLCGISLLALLIPCLLLLLCCCRAKVVDPLKMEAPLKRSLRRALKKCGYKEQVRQPCSQSRLNKLPTAHLT